MFALVPLACTTTQTGQPGGARPEIIFDDIGGIWQPARGVERNARPAIPDGQRYRASGPYQVNFSAIPANERRPANLDGMEYLRGGGRIESPLPDEVMDKLRNDSRFMRPSPRVQDPAAVTALAQAQTVSSAGTGFASIDLSECCGGGGSVPPDPELAAGPNHVIAVVNVAFEIYDTDGNSLGGPTTFESFFASDPNCSGEFDPNANYDESADRFILGIDGNGTDYCIAVSQTGDPTGNWNLYSFQTASRRDFFDYPHAGVGEDAIYLGANIFGARNFKEGRIWAIEKSALYAGNTPTVVSFGIGSDGTPQPMNLHGWNQGTWPTDGVHYILTDGQVYDGRNIGVWSWSNPFSGGVPVKEGEVDLVSASGTAAGMPVDAPQQGGGNLQANDWRVQDAEYRNGDIWTSSAIACNPGSGTVNCARWAQIDPSTPSVVNAGVVGSNGQYRSFPDLAVDHCGNMMMGYSKTSASSNPGVYATGRDNTGAIQSELTVKAAEAVYDAFDGSPHRWGDYTEMTISPDGSTFWYLGEYSKGINFIHGNWGTWVNSFTFGCDGGGGGGNTPPTAVIDTPSCTLLNCSFNGGNSSDSDGSINNYAWDFGDGNSSNAVSPSHTYAAAGTYQVSLTVTDDGSATDTANTSVTVDDGINNAPTAVITAINCSNATKICSYDGGGSSDSDGSISSYAWDFGDGTSGSGLNTSHTYSNYGSYVVSLTVTDNGGAASTNNASETITLTEPATATTMSVASVFVDTVNAGGGNKSPRATVVIQDDQGNPVGSVQVSGDFQGDVTGSDSGTTNGSGSVVLTSPDSKKGKVKFTFCVSDVSGSAALTWDGNIICASN
ncbi:MAG: PKD domain-containing protein [Lysobacterales bacterium]